MAIGVSLFVCIGLGGWFGVIDGQLALALIGGGALVGGIGWIDDHGHVPARWRGLVHLAAAVWGLVMVGGMETVRVGDRLLNLGLAGWVIGAFGIVWSINLYNFLDGIDGIASVQAVTAGVIGAGLAWQMGSSVLMLCAVLVAAASAGFLVWNWPPARIFMGDVGSGLLGYLFAILAVASEGRGGPPLVIWMMLLGVFIFDATVTLFRRMLAGERWYSAHRSHAYQRAVQGGWSHLQVTCGTMVIACTLGAMGAFAVGRPSTLIPVAVVAIGMLGTIYMVIERQVPMFQRGTRRSDSPGSARKQPLSRR